MKKRVISFLLALCLILTAAPAALAAESFSDVGTDHWAYADIQSCAQAGTVTGFEDGSFRPGDPVTDVQFIVMLTRTFYNEKVEAARATETSTWYAPNMKVAGELRVSMLQGLTVEDKAMNRYDMAMALYNVILNEGKHESIVGDQVNNAIDAIKDWGDVPINRSAAVPCCYALGILTGMEDGTFSGESTMTRAQACAVIMRMRKLIDKDAPSVDKDASQNASAAGTLANGQPVTEENVVAMLKEIEQEYPTGLRWDTGRDAGNNYYKDFTRNGMNIKGERDMLAINKIAPVGLQYACGGWACMVSETIFGVTGAPLREVYSFKDARPGDILYQINTKTGVASHIAIITAVKQVNGTWVASTCDGNINGHVSWTWGDTLEDGGGLGNYGMTNKPGTLTYRIFTRYPEA